MKIWLQRWRGIHSPAILMSVIQVSLCLPLEFLCKICVKLINLDSLLLHGISLAHSHGSVFLGLEIVSHAERRTNLLAVVLLRKLSIYLLGALVQLFGKGQYTDLHRSQRRMETKDCPHIPAF